MNIHRELEKYKLLALKAQTAMQDLRDATQSDQEAGNTSPSVRADVAAAIYCKIQALEREQYTLICDAFPNQTRDEKIVIWSAGAKTDATAYP